jgi:16S rRNA G527 N7-methylase RsmG
MSLNDLTNKMVIGSVEITIPWTLDDKNLLFLQTGYKDSEFDHDSEAVLKFLETRELAKIRPIQFVLDILPIGATIIDVGAGNSLTDVVINAMYPEKKFKFILVDGGNSYNKETPWLTGNDSYYQEGYVTYNNWSFLQKTVELNNMDMNMFVPKEPDDSWSDNQVDLVMTLSSWGWHYPIDTYLDKVNLIVKEDGWLYINKLMNINNAYNKVTEYFSKNITATSRKWVPMSGVDAHRPDSEVERMLKFMENYKMNSEKFSHVFIGQKLMKTYKLATLGTVSVSIPWSRVDREMLFWQSAPRTDYNNEDDEVYGIEKLNARMTGILSLLDPVLEKLPIGATIVDIGAGNSLLDILINSKFAEKKFKFILVDSDNTYPGVLSSNFYEDGYATYNNWSFLEKAIELNKMDSTSFITKAPEEQWSDQTVDLVISTASWGWHYPIDTYLKKTHELLKEDGYLYINEVLNIDNSLEKLSTLFNPIKVNMNKFIPTRSITENNRSLSFVVKNKIPVKKFGFVFLGQK